MNEFDEIENELKKLRPPQPSPVLFERIEQALAVDHEAADSPAKLERSRPRRLFYNVAWGVGLAAAAVLILFVRVKIDQQQSRGAQIAQTSPAPAITTRSTSANRLIPAGLTQVVYTKRDEGLHFPNGYTAPVRRLRYQTRETLQWRNPATGASLRVSYPSEEVVLIPVSGQ